MKLKPQHIEWLLWLSENWQERSERAALLSPNALNTLHRNRLVERTYESPVRVRLTNYGLAQQKRIRKEHCCSG